MEVLTRELAALYGACAQGLPSPLPPLPIQYADFAVWQRSWLQGEVLARQIAFWKETPGRRGGARPAERPAAPADPDLPRRHSRPVAPGRRSARRRGARRALAGDAFHGLPRRLRRPPRPPRRPGRRRGRLPDRQPHALRGRGADRLLRQHPGAARRLRRRARLRRAARAGAGRRQGGLRAPGPAVREGGRGAAAGARPQPHAALPGDVHLPGRRRARRRRCRGRALRPRPRAGGDRQRQRQVRPHPLGRRAAGRRPGRPRLPPRPLLPHHRPPHAPAVRGAARRGPRRSGPAVLRAAAAERGRELAGARRVERRRRPQPAGREPARSPRRGRRGDPASDGDRRGGGDAHLRRARAAGGAPRRAARGARGRPRGRRRRLPRPLGGVDRGAPGDDAGRWRLRAARSGLSARAARLPPRRFRRRPAGDRAVALAAPPRPAAADALPRRGGARGAGRSGRRGDPPARPRHGRCDRADAPSRTRSPT